VSIESIAAEVGSTPFMKPGKAKIITDLVREHDLDDVIELGFLHGVSVCYLADALRERGRGHVTALDLDDARSLQPEAQELVDRCGLHDWVTLHHTPTSYIWTLMHMLEEDPEPRFDLCYLDGAHDWANDGFAFFLVDKLLRPGAWIVFDDLAWTFAGSPSIGQTERVLAMPEDERTTPQVQKVFDLLVRTHPSYDEFRVVGDWGIAHKRAGEPAASGPTRVVKEVVVERERYGLGALAREALVKGRQRLRR
jgi:predicted O-methyltransferase YrrM